MTKYDELIARAVASMAGDADARQATYTRARDAMIARLRSLQPALPAANIAAERAALETAIHRAEMAFADSGADPMPPVAKPLRSRHRVHTAVLCGASLVVALIAGLYYADRNRPRTAAETTPATQVATSDSTERSVDAKPEAVVLPFIYMRQLVPYRSTNAPGTLVIDKAQRYLYVILPNVSAVRYGIALGGNCAEAAGRYVVSRKSGAPDLQQAAAISQPSGDRALYLDVDPRRIHDTVAARSIGRAVRAGCFQLMQADFAELYNRIPVGTRVVVN